MAEGTSAAPSLSARLKAHLKEAPFFCRIVELILCIIATGLIAGPFQEKHMRQLIDTHHVALFHVSVGGYILINAILIMGHLIGEQVPKKTTLLFTSMGTILCCTAGFVLIRDWSNFSTDSNMINAYLKEYNDRTVAAGSFAVIAAVVFALDTHFVKRSD